MAGRVASSGRLNGGFLPTNFSGNVLWLRGDLGASPAAWTDQSGSSNSGTQPTPGNQPPLLATGAPNSLPCFGFTAASQQFFTLPSLAALTEAELFFAARSDGTVMGPCNFSDPGGGLQFLYPYSDGHIYDNFGSTTRYDVGVPPEPVSNWCVYNVSAASGGAWSSRLNGRALVSTTGNPVAFSTAPTIGLTRTLYFTGRIAEIILYSSPRSAAERLQVLRYLGDRYSIPVVS